MLDYLTISDLTEKSSRGKFSVIMSNHKPQTEMHP